MNPLSFSAQISAEPTAVGNVFVSDLIRQQRQAERNFLNSVLRRESGAVISPSEFSEGSKQYFPRPGDDAKTLEQKAQNRKTATDALVREGGGAEASSTNENDPLGIRPKASAGANAGNIVETNIGGRKVTVDSSIAGKLAQADAEFFRDTGQHLQVNQSYRTREQQQALYEKSQRGEIGRAAPPGKSFHEKGLAIDVTNWQAAEKYLRKNGLVNDLADDRGHFSFGETNA